MKHLFEKLKKNSLWIELVKLFTGILLVTIIILFCFFRNDITVVLVALAAGIMNLRIGIKNYKVKKTRSMGMISIMMSMIIFFIGALFLRALF